MKQRPGLPAAARVTATDGAAVHWKGQCSSGLSNHSSGSGSAKESSILFLRCSGAGWLLSFHAGVGKFFQDHLRVEDPRLRFGGEAGGSLVCAALATGMDVHEVYEESLKAYEPCKHLPFRMGSLLKKALHKLAPADEVWRAASGKLVIGMSRLQMQGIKPSWHAERVVEFHSRAHGIAVLRASCHVPVVGGVRGIKAAVYRGGERLHERRYFDGALAERYPCMRPEDFLRPKEKEAGTPPADRVYNINVCAWGNSGEGYHISPGFNVPVGWILSPANPGYLLKLYRLGYLRAAEMFCRAPPELTAGLWRQDEFDQLQLPAIQDQIEQVLDHLMEEDPFCSKVLSFRTGKPKPPAPNPVEEDPASRISPLPLLGGHEPFSIQCIWHPAAMDIMAATAAAAPVIQGADSLGVRSMPNSVALPGLAAARAARALPAVAAAWRQAAAAELKAAASGGSCSKICGASAVVLRSAAAADIQSSVGSASSASLSRQPFHTGSTSNSGMVRSASTACLSPQLFHIGGTFKAGMVRSASTACLSPQPPQLPYIGNGSIIRRSPNSERESLLQHEERGPPGCGCGLAEALRLRLRLGSKKKQL